MIYNPDNNNLLSMIANTFNLKETDRIVLPCITMHIDQIVLAFDYPITKYLFFDFNSYKLQFSKIDYKKDLFLKALKPKQNREIVDLTCGSAKDSFHLLMLGFKVTAYENNPYLYILLNDAAKRFNSKVEWGNTINLEGLTIKFQDAKDAIESPLYYLDPMFERTKGLPKKEMQLMRKIIQNDGKKLFDLFKDRRLIVKRYKNDPPLSPPHHSIYGKSIRFDLYI